MCYCLIIITIVFKNCKNIKSVALDGARTYISSTSKYAVNALIVLDKFHIIQKLNNTVDSVRKLELRKARKENNPEAPQRNKENKTAGKKYERKNK